MLKNLLKKSVFTAVTATLLSATTATGQTIYWGAGHSNTLIDSIARFTANSSGSIAHLGWTLNANATVPQATWSYTTTGASNGPASLSWINNGTATTMSSPSIATGAIMFDSEAISEAIGDTDTDQGAHLVSPIIDLSTAAGEFISIKLFTNFFNFYSDTLVVELSTDGGTTYTGTDILVETGQASVRGQHNDWVSFVYPNRLSSVPMDLLNCRLRIRYYGNYYYFAFDDISIQAAPLKDIAIAVPSDDGTLGGTFSTFRVSNNYSMPLHQISAADSTQFLFGAKLVSKGAQDIDAADGASLAVTIEHNNNGTWQTVHTDAIAVAALSSTTATADAIFVEEFTGNWRPSALGEYRVSYEAILANSTDEVPGNNTSTHTFFVTENYFSKVPTSATTQKPMISQGIFPAAATGNRVTEFEYGTMFFFPSNTNNQKYKLDSVSYNALLSRLTSSTFDNSVNMYIKEFSDLDNDGRISDDPNSSELTMVGIGTGSITATVGSTNVSTPGAITVFQDVTTMDSVVFDFNKLYLVSFSCANPIGLQVNSQYNTYLPGAYGINYGLNASFSDAIPSPARTKIVTSTGAEASHNWNWIGFGADLAPSIGLHLSEKIVSIENVNNSEVNNFSVFPNPASDLINVTLEFDATTSAQIIMTDVTGRVVRLSTHKDVVNENVTFNLNDLSAGVYFISVKTDAGVSTQRFVKK